MTFNHIHLLVVDLPAAIRWIKQVWQAEVAFADERMAVIHFDAFTVIFDQSSTDSPATLGFESTDCDADYNAVVGRGAISLEAPANQIWGARSAYLRGPGAITFEIEQNIQ